MSTALVALTTKLASRLDMGNGDGLIETLKATAFKGQVSDAQMTALMVVANQYGLNPWTRELYAFPDKNNGIVPVVGVDGWARIMNDHPQFDGMEFEQDMEQCTCIIYRKDRSHAIKATEYMQECYRETGPWKSHPRRMLRHKAMIQCARLAFGFGGIYDQDEAERIVEGVVLEPDQPVTTGRAGKPERETLTKETLLKKFSTDKVDKDGVVTQFCPKSLIQRGEETAQGFVDFLNAKYVLPADVIEEINSWTPKDTQ